MELIFRVTNYDFNNLIGTKITGFIHNYPILSTFYKHLSMESENSLRYNSVRSCITREKSACQRGCSLSIGNQPPINFPFPWSRLITLWYYLEGFSYYKKFISICRTHWPYLCLKVRSPRRPL